ncbi:hypothetical protein [Micromonospora maritima]|uniref:hypothetical protein n=1 Tax=Micromonospora maritima TaxID=986711 RepID=UPI0037AAEDBA
MLRDDVRCAMPPTPSLHVGRDAVVQNWVDDGFAGMTGLRGVPTAVNRQPAVAFYQWREREGAYLPLTLDVLRVTGGAITETFMFHADRFARLGLPERLPADGTRPHPGRHDMTCTTILPVRRRAGPAGSAGSPPPNCSPRSSRWWSAPPRPARPAPDPRRRDDPDSQTLGLVLSKVERAAARQRS